MDLTQTDAVRVEYWTGSAWAALGTTDLGTLLRTRRLAPRPGFPVMTSKIRVVKVGDHDWGDQVFRIAEVRCWGEAETVETARLWPFTFDTAEQQYMLAATPYNVEVFRRGWRQCAVPLPYDADQLALATKAQKLDTLLTFHADVQPVRLQRQGAHDEWDSRPLTLKNIPIFDFTGEKLNGENEEQQIRFKDYNVGDTFSLILDGETTDSIVFDTDEPTTVANIQAALDALPSVGPGNSLVSSTGTNTYKIVFQGALAATDVAELVPQTRTSNNGLVYAATLKQGVPGGEPIVSDTRGWFACGTFYQGRLFLGGLRSRPQTLLSSRLGFHFDLLGKGAQSNRGLNQDLDTDEKVDIQAFFPGQHLQVFTQAGEFFFSQSPIVPNAPIDGASRRGHKQGTPIVELAGATLFVTMGGDALAEAIYDDNRRTYVAPYLSALASHIVTGVVDFGLRRSRSTQLPDLALIVRDTGEGVLMHALRDQEMAAFAPCTTDGAFVAAAAEMNGDLYAITSRENATGTARLCLERFSFDHMLDSSVRVEGAVSQITGLDHLEGRTVALYIDGADAGDAVVTGGAVDLPYPSTATAEAGLLFQPRGVTLPPVYQQDQRPGLAKAPRTVEIHFKLGPTANLKAGKAGGPMWRVPLKARPGALLDEGPGVNAFEGWTRVQGVKGFQRDGQIEWVQERPGPLEIREIVVKTTT